MSSYTFNSLVVRGLSDKKQFRYLHKIPQVVLNDVERTYLEFILDFNDTYNLLPTVDILKDNFKAFRLDYLDEETPTEYAVDCFIEVKQKEYIRAQINLAKEKGFDIYDPVFLLRITQDSQPKSVEIIDYNTFDREEHFETVDRMEFGIEWFDKTFGGIWATDYNLIFGSLGNGKTNLLLLLVHLLHKKQDKNILVFSNEMPTKTFINKLDAFAGGVNPKLFRTLDFEDDQKERVLKLRDEFKEKQGKIFVAGTINHPSELKPIIDSLPVKIDMIFIDGIHLMGKSSASNMSEKSIQLGEVSRLIRQFTLNEQIPVFAVAQGNREAAKTDEPSPEKIGLAYSMVQDVDNAITSTKVEINGKTMFKYYSSKCRYNDQDAIYAHFDWDKMGVSWYKVKELEEDDF